MRIILGYSFRVNRPVHTSCDYFLSFPIIFFQKINCQPKIRGIWVQRCWLICLPPLRQWYALLSAWRVSNRRQLSKTSRSVCFFLLALFLPPNQLAFRRRVVQWTGSSSTWVLSSRTVGSLWSVRSSPNPYHSSNRTWICLMGYWSGMERSYHQACVKLSHFFLTNTKRSIQMCLWTIFFPNSALYRCLDFVSKIMCTVVTIQCVCNDYGPCAFKSADNVSID